MLNHGDDQDGELDDDDDHHGDHGGYLPQLEDGDKWKDDHVQQLFHHYDNEVEVVVHMDKCLNIMGVDNDIHRGHVGELVEYNKKKDIVVVVAS